MFNITIVILEQEQIVGRLKNVKKYKKMLLLDVQKNCLKMCNIGKKVRAVGAAGQLPTADGLRHFAQCSDGDRPFEMDTLHTFCTLCTLFVNFAHFLYTLHTMYTLYNPPMETAHLK